MLRVCSVAQALSQSKRALLEQRIRGTVPLPRPAAPAVTRRTGGRPARLSLAQEQLWYFSQLVPENPVYNEAASIRKDGDCDLDSLRWAFNEIVRRHEIWRTRFEIRDGVPVQEVFDAPRFELPLTDLSGLPPEAREDAATRLVAEAARQPYRLADGALIRPILLRFAPDHHRLYLAMHHMIFDGVSLYRIVLPELIALYDAAREKRPSRLPESSLQYADYAEWEQGQVGTAEMRRRLAYWRARLDGAPRLELPLDEPRPPRQRFRGAMEQTQISADLVRSLRTLARQEGCTLFQLIAAAFAVLLQRYSGQEDVVFGTMADLRMQPEIEHMVGYCLTPVALRLDLSGDPTFTEVLRRAREEVLGALANLVPFERVVREVQPQRDPSMNPIYQAMVVMEPPVVSPDSSWTLHQMDVAIGNAVGHAKLDLHLELDERPDGHLAGRLIYNRDVFQAATARRLAGHFDRLLKEIAANPNRRAADVPLLSEREIHEQVAEWNSTEAPYPGDRPLHELIQAQADRTPDAIAARCGEVGMTYRELDRRANRLARSLRAAGVRRGDLVAICVSRSLEMLVGMLGILKAGAAYVPLDPNYPADRLRFMVEDSGARVVLTQAGIPAWLSGIEITIVHIAEVERSAGLADSPPAGGATSDDLAYVIYTSGSTGKPKGVLIPHRAVVNLVWSMAREPGITAADRVLAITTYSFDIAVVELWLPLMRGAQIELAPSEVVADPQRLTTLFEQCRPTFMQATPATWRMLIESGWKGDPGLVALAGGEAVDSQLADQILDRCGRLWNVYGPTETTVWSTVGPIESGERISIGRPLANTSVYILDRRRRLLPVGVPGEIYIGGHGVARGYLNRPELTADRFVTDPLRPGTIMYRTGDLARFWSDGRIEHLGRLDNQVKVRGYRIETGEVEAALVRAPQVAAAAVVAREDQHGDRELVAYIVPAQELDVEAPLNVGALRASLRKTLPDFMIPTQFVKLSSLPMTPNGKVDRKSLPAPEIGAQGGSREYVLPRTPLEEKLAETWGQILGGGRVGVDDDFFELGGHSLLAVRLISEVQRVTGVQVAVASFLSGTPTVAGMAKVISEGAQNSSGQLLFKVQPNGTKPPLFFVHAHETSLLTLRHFTQVLGPDQPLIALLPERHDLRFDRSGSVEDMAATLVQVIRAEQAAGPYYIAGHSFGGIIAYELATQLRRTGAEVRWLAVLDAGTPADAGRWLEARLNPRARFGRLRRLGLRRAPAKVFEVVKRESNDVLAAIGRKLDPLGDAMYDWEGAISLVVRYVPAGCDAPMELFTPTEQLMFAGGKYLGWDEVHRGTLAIYEVPGDHLSMLQEPQVEVLAQLVASRLEAAQAALPQAVVGRQR